MIIETTKKLIAVYSKCNFKYYWIFYLSILTSLLLSFAEASFLGSIYVLIESLADSSSSIFYFNNKILIFIKDFFDLDSISFYLILSGLAIIMVTLLKILNIFFNTFLYYKINALITSQIFLKTISQDLKFHNNTNSSSMISAIVQKAKSVGEISFFLLGIAKSLFTLVAVTALAIYISSKIFLLFFLVFFILFFIIYITFKKKIKNIGIQIALLNDKAIKVLQENYSSIIFIILYNCQKIVSKTFDEVVSKLRKSEAEVVFFSTVPYIFIQAFTVISILFFIKYYDAKNNFVSIVPLATMWILAIQRLIPSFNEIFSSLSTIKGVQKNFSDTNFFLNLTSRNADSEIQENNINFNNQISFENVSFSFNSNTPLVLKKLNFKIKKNSIVAIKGVTGSGKSTLISILMGYYDPNEGRVLIDEKILSQENVRSWQAKISYVPQKVFLFDDTIKANIAFAEGKVDDILMKQSIHSADLEDFVIKQNKGLETFVGENADRISGGQKQRIGIARAIYKNTNLLILDESLNSLDYKTKTKILENIRRLGKTIVLISHDENDLKVCDRILDMDNFK